MCSGVCSKRREIESSGEFGEVNDKGNQQSFHDALSGVGESKSWERTPELGLDPQDREEEV
jgi:hypothetical protein